MLTGGPRMPRPSFASPGWCAAPTGDRSPPMKDDSPDRPTVKLRPGKGRRLEHGAPWAYADEIAMDRRAKAIPAGTIVRLAAPAGEQLLGAFAFNGASQIAARFLDADPDAAIDAAWLSRRLSRALALRRALGHDPAFGRLVHAEGDGLL